MEINKIVEQTLAEKTAAQTTKDMITQSTQKAKETKELIENSRKKKTTTKKGKDQVDLSVDGRQLYKYNKDYQKAKNDEMIIKKHEEQRKKALEKAKKEKRSASYKAKMMEIARRIANGDKVPPEDERKLREFNQELYLTVKSMALLNKKPKEYDSLFGKEKQDGVTIEQEESPSLMDTMDDILSDDTGGEGLE